MITVWHVISLICLIAATASASESAKAEQASPLVYTACIAVGVIVGLVAAFGNVLTATLARRRAEKQTRIAKHAIPIVTLIVSVGWIVLADVSGRWVSNAVLRAFEHR